MKDRYNILTNHEEFSLNRSVYKAMGYNDDDLERPVIGIAITAALVTDGAIIKYE